jgi:hypothetical protein
MDSSFLKLFCHSVVVRPNGEAASVVTRRKMRWGTGFVGRKGIMGQENVLGRVALVAEKERKHVGPQGGFGLEGNVEE